MSMNRSRRAAGRSRALPVGLLGVAVALVGGCAVPGDAGGGAAAATTGAVPASGPVVEAAFGVEGMTCGGCAATVKVAAERLPGVRSARVSVDEGRAWVAYEPGPASPEVIARAITDSGFRATPLADVAGAPPATAGTMHAP